jgi:hypothetical protein
MTSDKDGCKKTECMGGGTVKEDIRTSYRARNKGNKN